VGQLVPLGLFYSDYVFGQMALSSAGAFVIAGICLWLSWRRAPWYAKRQLVKRDEQRITLAGVLVLGLTVGTAMLAGFAVMVGPVRDLAANSQLELLNSNVTLFRLNLESRVDRVALMTDRPVLRQDLALLNSDTRDPAVSARLLPSMKNMMTQGFSAIEVADAKGRVWVSEGTFAPAGIMIVPLKARLPSMLLWHDGFVLRTEVPMIVDGAAVATIRVEQRLPALTEFMAAEHLLEESGEIGLCGRTATQFVCFPQRLIPRPYTVSYSAELPMGRALSGNTGAFSGRDYRRENVIAAHGPVGDFGLGMVVKADTADLYLPLRRDMYRLLGLMVLILAVGGWILYRSVTPLTRRLEHSESRLQLALEGSAISLWDWDLASGRVYLSERWAELLGEPPHPMTMQVDKLQAMVHPDDLPMLLKHLGLVMKGTESAYDVEHRIRLPDGRERWIRSRGKVAGHDAAGRVARMVGTNVDITRRKEAEFLLSHQASHDALTGLPNRLFFKDRLEQAMARSQRQESLMAVMYMDIDKFKSINDTLGHEAGDVLLKEFAARMSTVLRTTDTAVRLGGDEFVMILEGLGDREDGLRVADKVAAAMKPQFALGKTRLRITTSAGLAFYQGELPSVGEALLRRADEALYAAKAAGRNNIKVAA
jgi:diguanylate cyclase (GGDEF)-like protein/PAS domain S-box-containing protein